MRRLPSAVRLVFIGMIMSSVACGSSTDDETGSAPTATPPAAATTSSPTASGLEGSWRTDPITVSDMTRTLRDHDLGKWVGRFERNAPVSRAPTALILQIRDGDWDLSKESQGGAPEEIDYDARYDTDGNRVVVSHEGDSNTYRWSLRGESLMLTWEKTTYGSYKGIPEEVFQRALYMTAKFMRAG